VWSNWGLSIPAATTYPRSPLTRGSTAFAIPPAPVWSISAKLGAASVVESVRSRHGAFAEEMPYRDPHTAAPCLWAVQREEAEKLEVSVTTPTLAEDKQSRKAFGDALIAVYRREWGESTANFGRIIDGYRQSTYRSGEERGGPLEPGQTE